MALPVPKEDLSVYDENLGIYRRLLADQPVPPDLVEAYEKATGTRAEQGKARRGPARDKAVRGPQVDKAEG